jgi:RNA polymerase sigma-70 factor (ECF subfamily)
LTSKQKEFLEAIEPHKGIIFKVSKVYCDDINDQEDLRQEILYQIWNSVDNFRNQSQFSTWLYRVALNTAILYFKKRKKETEKSAEYHKWQEQFIDEIDDSDEKLKLLYQSFQHLDKIEKAIIFMYLEDKSQKEIAQTLGISEVNARVKLHRTKEKIKSIIFKNKNYEI